MSLKSALQVLRKTTAELEQAVAELVMIVHEDRPAQSQVAVVDHLAETVSEFQADAVAAARQVGAITDPVQLAGALGPVDESIGSCAQVYWRDLRAFAPVQELRRTAHGRSLEWRTWQRSLEQSMARCEEPLDRAGGAVRGAWQEVGELLEHWLPAAPAEPIPQHRVIPEDASMDTRRSS